ncbi:MAG: flavin reductase [Lachnospiraceae bacterium]|nr:flavin reductase [Candidatus Minthocola equi]
MDSKVYQKLSYGLYVLSVRCGKRDNACIINTAMQLTAAPERISFALNKADFTCEMLDYADDVTISVISEDADFELFRHFGFQSGRDVEKFEGFGDYARTASGLPYITKGTNAYIEAHVEQKIDLGTHILYIAAVTDGAVLSDVASATYAYYFAHIKPQPEKLEKVERGGKTIWRCMICGYEYEGDEVPADFICPICKHGADVFEKVN